MAAHVTHSRKGLRRLERATGERLVWSTGNWVTTIDHRHLVWDGTDWHPIPDQEAAATVAGYSPCGLPTNLASCQWLFGEPEHGFTRGLMRGPCRKCGVGCSELHRWDCAKLDSLMGYVNPDYWPRPVHRPQWMDDPRRDRVNPYTQSAFSIALALNVPIELVGIPKPGGPNHWSHWLRPEET